ncbi:hypothetical protein ACFOTA_06865 [Chitinophaga sp. GCM10012297]|uniref:Uncharacterized protein n=1 Tax=Chitinophaga chungangae TaxID=2821488 RepID=A0ABS3YB82_9BACT|nr:hypothetical protein [Chitinophaga chungangae]MBO9151920.1 hypothetical protein [Chitinophaga chungangae]
MHHTTRKKYVGLKETGLTAEELKAEMLQNEVPEAEADKLIEELYAPALPEDPKEPKEPKPAKKNQADEDGPNYEEWKMGITRDSNGQVELEKIKKIKDVRIDNARAERLNLHSENTRIKYFKK